MWRTLHFASVHCSRRPACCPSPMGCHLHLHAPSVCRCMHSACGCQRVADQKNFRCQEDAKPAPAAAAAATPPAEAPAKAEKPKNPLDALPPSKMARLGFHVLTNQLVVHAGLCGPFERATRG